MGCRPPPDGLRGIEQLRNGANDELLPGVEQDLVLDRDELQMLEIFHRSFNLPGLRLGLVRPHCSEDYFPEEEGAAAEHAAGFVEEETDAHTAELRNILHRTEQLRLEADSVLTVEEEEVVDETCEEAYVPTARPSARAHVRSVRPSSSRPSSGTRPRRW
jgi:hypothetical protein